MLFILILSALYMQCSNSTYVAPSPLAIGTTEAINQVSVENPTMQLYDYLKRVPGLQVTGTYNNPIIRIRNPISIEGFIEPLYVIDRIPIGNTYSDAAAAVDVNDISKITVLKDVSSSAMYGLRGANGVIIITTKD